MPSASETESPDAPLGNAGPTVPPAAHAYRWVMFGGLVGVYFSFGVMVASIPPMVAVVREDLDMSRGSMGLALSAWTLLYIGTAHWRAGWSIGWASAGV